jgi:choline monooxygenase
MLNEADIIRIDQETAHAGTLPGSFYREQEQYEQIIEKIFYQTWQFVSPINVLVDGPCAYPFRLLPGSIDEPLVLTKNEHQDIKILSNVCTHRGNILVTNASMCRELRCGYHGRRFHLDGRFKYMPESNEIAQFPSPDDDLPQLPVHCWKGLLFTSLSPSLSFSNWMTGIEDRIGWIPMEDFKLDPVRSQEFIVKAHWALYCDNYLEGFHIPFVHPELNQSLDFSNYETHILENGVLQIGIAANDQELCFELPPDSPDYGKSVAAYYYWFFPNIMLNFYPWGLSLNIVLPQAFNRTKVIFQSYVWKPELLDQGAGGALNTVELQDETIVEQVQLGVQSRLYRSGRYSPRLEKGVHHFHKLVVKTLKE